MDTRPYIVYVKTDAQYRIISAASSAFLCDTDGWIAIDSGHGDKFLHAQGNYFDKPIFDERGIPQYKMFEGRPVERSQDEMNADYVEPENPEPIEKRVENVEGRTIELEEALNLLLSGVTE